jgi:hypothetical protein
MTALYRVWDLSRIGYAEVIAAAAGTLTCPLAAAMLRQFSGRPNSTEVQIVRWAPGVCRAKRSVAWRLPEER